MSIQDYVKRIDKKFIQDSRRVIAKMYIPGGERVNNVVNRILALKDDEVTNVMKDVLEEFSDRHIDLMGIFDRHFQKISNRIPNAFDICSEKRALIGAYFTHEYSIQAAAFFNPSIVLNPDQSHLKKGSARFVLSFRSTGEGHISSIEFRSGIINNKNEITFDPISRYVHTPEITGNPMYDKYTFRLKLAEMIKHTDILDSMFYDLRERFSLEELQKVIESNRKHENNASYDASYKETIEGILWLARSNYDVKFKLDRRISERVIFPVSENESKGIEDARFVLFTDDNGEKTYYATYTAYNGFNILPMLIETKDFIDFKIRTLNGKAVQNKGMALFPRKINGKYMMISRQDGENMFIMSSDNIHFWHKAKKLYSPEFPWEFIQVGNSGSPLELDEGWLLLTHGVGPMRKYSIGALLLDLEDPSKIIKWLPDPLISPNEEEREGYVPNVVYSCGAMIYNKEIIIPYAMSDTVSGIATISVEKLLKYMEPFKSSN